MYNEYISIDSVCVGDFILNHSMVCINIYNLSLVKETDLFIE